jgi:triacylglycerol lipase
MRRRELIVVLRVGMRRRGLIVVLLMLGGLVTASARAAAPTPSPSRAAAPTPPPSRAAAPTPPPSRAASPARPPSLAAALTPPPALENLIGHLYVSPGISPPGANNWNCKPSAARPYPVVLVHGTLFDQTMTWNLMAPAIEHAGYCVFALDYGNRGTGPIAQSAAQLAAFIQKVLTATGAQRVDIVGHSQGGMMPRYYLKFMGGTAYVHDLIGLAPSNHGTTLALAALVGQYGDCPACTEQVVGSPFLEQLNAGDQTPPPVNYTVIESNHDEIVTPYTSAFLPSEDGRVTNGRSGVHARLHRAEAPQRPLS